MAALMGKSARNPWDLFSLCLWGLFFVCGLMPEPVFYLLRDLAAVTTPSALVNSSLAITVSFAAYFAFFVMKRCREAGASVGESQARALQAFVLCLVAFLEFPPRGSSFEVHTLLQLLLTVQELPSPSLQAVVLLVSGCKLLTWLYLLSLVVRYHAYGNRAVFAKSAILLPSARHKGTPIPPPPPQPAKHLRKPPAAVARDDNPEDRLGN